MEERRFEHVCAEEGQWWELGEGLWQRYMKHESSSPRVQASAREVPTFVRSTAPCLSPMASKEIGRVNGCARLRKINSALLELYGRAQRRDWLLVPTKHRLLTGYCQGSRCFWNTSFLRLFHGRTFKQTTRALQMKCDVITHLAAA